MEEQFMKKRWSFLLWVLALAAALMTIPLQGTASADTTIWNGGDGNFSDITYWSDGLPDLTHDAALHTFGTVVFTSDYAPLLRELSISSDGSGNMSLIHSSGILTLDEGSYLYVNSETAGIASYTLSNTGVLIKKSMEVKIGTNGTGYFNQNGGTFNFNGALYLGDQSGGRGIYTMTDGEITGYYGTLQEELDDDDPANDEDHQHYGGIVLGEWGGKGEFDQSGSAMITINDLTLGRQESSEGYYRLKDDAFLTVHGAAQIGGKGTGTFNQLGGAFDAGEVQVGVTGLGEYNLHGGVLSSGLLVIGGKDGVINPGTGVFNQDGGINNAGGMWIADTEGSSGTYNLSNGDLFVTTYNVIGMRGQGIFNQTGGVHTANGLLELGGSPTAKGTYNLISGALNTAGTIVGSWGEGEFNQDGGYAETGHLVLADSIGSKGTYNLHSGDLFVGSYDVIGAAGNGVFNQYGGSHISDGFLAIGTAGSGTYNLIDGFLSSNNIFVGESAVGEFHQSGGAHHVGMEIDIDGNLIPKAGLHELIVARKAGSTGKYFLSGGELHAAREIVGDQGFGSVSRGEFHQSGSSRHTIYQDLIIGQDPMSVGLFTLSQEAQLMVFGNIFLGDETGNGTFEQTGGALTVDGGLYIGSSSESGNNPGKGIYKLTGGTLTANTIFNNGLFTGIADIGRLTVTGGFTNSGVVAPGQSPGTLTITGDYIQDPIGTLLIELGGNTQGVDYDYLNITGLAVLGGILEVTLWNGFNPQNGDIFDILQAGSISGEFDFNQLIMPNGWSWEIAYLNLDDGISGNDIVRLTANAVPLPNAIWLLSSGVIGLIGIRRKTSQ